MYNYSSSAKDAPEILIIGERHDNYFNDTKRIGNFYDYLTLDRQGIRRRNHVEEAYALALKQKERKLDQFKPDLILLEGIDYGDKNIGKNCERFGGHMKTLYEYSANKKCLIEGIETQEGLIQLGKLLWSGSDYDKDSNDRYAQTIADIIKSTGLKKVVIQIGRVHLTTNKVDNLKGCNLQDTLHSAIPEAKIKVYIPPAYSYIDSVNGTRRSTTHLTDIPNYRGRGKKEPWLVNKEPKTPGLWERLRSRFERKGKSTA